MMSLTKTMRRLSSAAVIGCFAALAAPPILQCEETGEKTATVAASYTLPDLPLGAFQGSRWPDAFSNDRRIFLGSVGSDLWRGPADPQGEFWMITDRGPNGLIKIDGANRRTFLAPEFNPTILRAKLDGGAIRILETIPIVTRSGKPVTGLPNVEGRDETPYDHSGQNKLSFNPNGLDIEGLVQTKTGEFWLAEEYGPSLLKVDRAGMVLKRYVPEGIKMEGADYPVDPALPAILAKRIDSIVFGSLENHGGKRSEGSFRLHGHQSPHLLYHSRAVQKPDRILPRTPPQADVHRRCDSGIYFARDHDRTLPASELAAYAGRAGLSRVGARGAAHPGDRLFPHGEKAGGALSRFEVRSGKESRGSR
jgi:hypothetical protein